MHTVQKKAYTQQQSGKFFSVCITSAIKA